MRSLVILFVISFFSFGCSTLNKMGESIDRAISRDGLTSAERAEAFRKDQEEKRAKRIADEKEAEEKLQACIRFCNDNKYSDMKRFETCKPPDRKGLAKNSVATFYFWYELTDGPTYYYFDKNGKFIIEEIDQETIYARRSERIRQAETAENLRLQRIQTYNSSIAVQNQSDQNREQRRQNCIRNSSAAAAPYCN